MNEILSFKNDSDVKSFVTQLTSPYTQSARGSNGRRDSSCGFNSITISKYIYIYIAY